MSSFTVLLEETHTGISTFSEERPIPFTRFTVSVTDAEGYSRAFYVYQHQTSGNYFVHHQLHDDCLHAVRWSKTIHMAFTKQKNMLKLYRDCSKHYHVSSVITEEITSLITGLSSTIPV